MSEPTQGVTGDMMLDVQRRLTDELVESIHRQRVVHRARRASTDNDLTLLWPLPATAQREGG